MTTLFLTQNLFKQGKSCRTQSTNAHYVLAFGNPRDRNQIQVLIRQAFPGQTKYAEEAFKDAPNRPHGYLLFDFDQRTTGRLSLTHEHLAFRRPAADSLLAGRSIMNRQEYKGRRQTLEDELQFEESVLNGFLQLHPNETLPPQFTQGVEQVRHRLSELNDEHRQRLLDNIVMAEKTLDVYGTLDPSSPPPSPIRARCGPSSTSADRFRPRRFLDCHHLVPRPLLRRQLALP